MPSLGVASVTGAAFRPVAGRSLFHTQLTEIRPTTVAARSQYQSVLRHYHSRIPCRTLQIGRKPLQKTTTRRLSSANTHKHRKASFVSPRYLPLLILLAVAGVAWDSQWLFPSPIASDPTEATVLGNARKFVRFDVVDKQQVSPTSFILTLKAPHSGALPSLASLWEVFDLWCVEIKQPQIQVAREYTPLPPSPGDSQDTLRLYVRALRGGEVSTYLSRQGAGDSIELRGPHGEFDLRSRLGASGDRVVFLAGGTGIASALQAAHAVLPLPGAPSMTIFWAVRNRDEIHAETGQVQKPAEAKSSWSWNPFSRRAQESKQLEIQAEALSSEVNNSSPITRELLALKEKYGDRLDVRVVVDQEGTLVREPDLAAALTKPDPNRLNNGVLRWATTAGCKFHSQAAHIGMVDGSPNAGKRFLFTEEGCACSPKDGAALGKNVFVVSGPEGFVQAYAGAKIWRDGGQLQGPVGGMLGAMQRSNPDLLKDWIVLKL